MRILKDESFRPRSVSAEVDDGRVFVEDLVAEIVPLRRSAQLQGKRIATPCRLQKIFDLVVLLCKRQPRMIRRRGSQHEDRLLGHGPILSPSGSSVDRALDSEASPAG